jgi:zinc transport system substrate-binding protein
MRKIVFVNLLAVCLAISTAWLQGCSQEPSPEQSPKPSSDISGDRLKIAATIFPLYDIARNVAGDGVEVICILPPGASPHSYSPSPRGVRKLDGARLVFSVGRGLDDWTQALVEMLPGAKKIVVDGGIHEVESTALDGHEHEGKNPHYWLSTGNGKVIARNMAEHLSALDPAGADRYRTNLDAYILKLEAAGRRISEKVEGLPSKKMLTFHDAWVYYADEFGLEIVGSIEPFPGRIPTPRYLVGLHEKVKRHAVTAIFSEPQLSGEVVASFTDDMGLKLYTLDPLGGVEGRETYIEMLEYNTEIIVEALSNGR